MHKEKVPHRVWAEINLDAICENYKKVRALAPARRVMCIVKADAYGHGALPVARALSAIGADFFGVATPEEALRLRRNGITGDILLLDVVKAVWAPLMVENEIEMTVADLKTAEEYAQELSEDMRLKVHIKVNTGMNRLGFDAYDDVSETLKITKIEAFDVVGLFTHFACAGGVGGEEYTRMQYANFAYVGEDLAEKGFVPKMYHCANSGGIIMHEYSHADVVRPGIMLYGVNPCEGADINLQPALCLKSNIVQLRHIKKDEAVSYGCLWVAQRDSVIATVAIGYADGLPSAASGKLEMIVNGVRVPQIGRICMDMCMLDVTDVECVNLGDEVVVIGTDKGERIPVEDIAKAAGSISYEVLCGIGMRVPRLYCQGGRKVGEICYLDLL